MHGFDSPLFDRLGRNAFLFFAFLAGLLIWNWPHLTLPFTNDSLGYVIFNTKHMLEQRSWFQPLDHDTGHGPVCFVALLALWKLFGTAPFVSHLCQMLWGALLLLGAWRLLRAIFPDNRLPALVAVLLLPNHPHLSSQLLTLVLDIPTAGLLLLTLHARYQQRPWWFLFWFSIALLTRLNALPLLFFLTLTECVFLPALRLLLGNSDNENVRSEFFAGIKYSLLGCVALLPLAIWHIFRHAWTGLWLQSPVFNISTESVQTAAEVRYRLFEYSKIAMFSGEGNSDIFLMIAALLAATVGAIVLGGKIRDVLRKREFALGSRLGLSLLIQTALIIALLSVKSLLLVRFYLHLQVFLIVLLGLAVGFFCAATGIKLGRWRDARRRAIALGLIVVIPLLASLLLRQHPYRTEFLPPPVAAHFRHQGPIGYDMNLQLLDHIALVCNSVRALRSLIEAGGKPDALVVAVYPYSRMLTLREGGFVTEPFNIVSHYSEHEMLSNVWDYYWFSPAQDGLRVPPTDALTAAKNLTIAAEIDFPRNPWNLEYTIYQSHSAHGAPP